MLKLHEIDGRRLINSIELYRLLGCSMAVYYRWVKNNIVAHGVADFDYISAGLQHMNNGSEKLPRRKSEVYYVTIDFAKALCLVVKTPAAKRTRIMLHYI